MAITHLKRSKLTASDLQNLGYEIIFWNGIDEFPFEPAMDEDFILTSEFIMEEFVSAIRAGQTLEIIDNDKALYRTAPELDKYAAAGYRVWLRRAA